MSNKTNDERLKVLRERLEEIKYKKDPSLIANKIKKEEKEEEVEAPKITLNPTNKPSSSFKWFKYIAAILVIGCAIFYINNQINSQALTKEENTIVEKPEVIEQPVEYNLNLEGYNIIIKETYSENDAKMMKEELITKGFQADYFFLPDKSNSSLQVYKVFLGPYENKKERDQWKKNLNVEFELL